MLCCLLHVTYLSQCKTKLNCIQSGLFWRLSCHFLNLVLKTQLIKKIQTNDNAGVCLLNTNTERMKQVISDNPYVLYKHIYMVMVHGSVWGVSTYGNWSSVHPFGVELPASHMGLICKQSVRELLKLVQPATPCQFIMLSAEVTRQLFSVTCFLLKQ